MAVVSPAAPPGGPASRLRLRGALHLAAFPVSLVAGLVLVLAVADGPAERWGCAVYAPASAVLPSPAEAGGGAVVALIVAGGLAYSLGGLVYALRRPDPVPDVYGDHEVFHTSTLVGFATHDIAVVLAVS